MLWNWIREWIKAHTHTQHTLSHTPHCLCLSQIHTHSLSLSLTHTHTHTCTHTHTHTPYNLPLYAIGWLAWVSQVPEGGIPSECTCPWGYIWDPVWPHCETDSLQHLLGPGQVWGQLNTSLIPLLFSLAQDRKVAYFWGVCACHHLVRVYSTVVHLLTFDLLVPRSISVLYKVPVVCPCFVTMPLCDLATTEMVVYKRNWKRGGGNIKACYSHQAVRSG